MIKSFFFLVLSTFLYSTYYKSGDVILISFNCYECQVIEDETQLPYSHSGVLFMIDGRPWVAQALGTVHWLPLEDFLRPLRPGTKPLILRSKVPINALKLLSVYKKKFEGAGFDPDYLWDNVDKSRREIYYCSEFVAKLLDEVLAVKTTTYPQTYGRNLAYWKKYFKGRVPEGKLGVAPGHFAKDNRFIVVK